MKIEITDEIKQDIKKNIESAKGHVDKQLRKPIHHRDQSIIDAYMGYITKMTQKLESNAKYL
jgi:hypothetical protein